MKMINDCITKEQLLLLINEIILLRKRVKKIFKNPNDLIEA